MKTPLIIIGACGRMGQSIISLGLQDQNFSIVAGVTHTITEKHLSPIPLETDLLAAVTSQHSLRPVLIDFSVAQKAQAHLEIAQEFGLNMVLGTTGHPKEHDELFLQAAQRIALVVAPNTSLMAALMKHSCHLLSQALPKSQRAILDIHHCHKKDAPSGTALDLAKVMPKAAIESLRLGQIVGEHTAYFVNDFERLEITHQVSDRRVFAQGALVAAQFIFTQKPGLYDMNDVLNLKFSRT